MWSALKEGVVELAFLRSSVVTDLCKLDFPTVDAEKKNQKTPYHPYHLIIRNDVDVISIIGIKATMEISIFIHRDLCQ